MMAQAPAVVSIVLGAMALLLAAVGMFGVAAQLVARRTCEIAIRVSLGAQPRDVIGTVLREALRPVAAGTLFGALGAIGLSVLLRAMIAGIETPDLTYGAGAFDPIVFAGALGTLALAALTATLWPVRKALAIAPAEALRAE
jgi:ABC-type lipoprotein release transport system permease subunit